MEKHVVSLEIAKKLKEAGFSKPTEFWWTQHKEQQDNPAYKDCAMVCNKETLEMYPIEFWNVYPAPLASEILEELPCKIKSFYLHIHKNDFDYLVHYQDMLGNVINNQDIYSVNLCDALALMYIHLKKEGVI